VYHQNATGDKLFPIGNGTTYLPVSVLNIGTSSEVGVTLFEFSTPQNFDFRPELSDVSSKRYWEVDLVNGSLASTQISLPVRGDEDLTSTISDFVAVHSPVSPIEFSSSGQSSFTGTSTSGTVVSNAVSAGLVSLGILSEETGITVYNAISADGDERNAIMKINNIAAYPNHKVSIFNRWGDKVFEMKGYNNADMAFIGESNVGGNKELPAGTYFYVIDKGDGSPPVNGYLSLKR
jgi:gliding motility-associated-like protein